MSITDRPHVLSSEKVCSWSILTFSVNNIQLVRQSIQSRRWSQESSYARQSGRDVVDKQDNIAKKCYWIPETRLSSDDVLSDVFPWVTELLPTEGAVSDESRLKERTAWIITFSLQRGLLLLWLLFCVTLLYSTRGFLDIIMPWLHLWQDRQQETTMLALRLFFSVTTSRTMSFFERLEEETLVVFTKLWTRLRETSVLSRPSLRAIIQRE